MDTPMKVLIVFNCDVGEGIHVSFARPVKAYHVHKIAKKLSGLTSLRIDAYEMAEHQQHMTHILLFKGGGSVVPKLSRTICARDPFDAKDMQVSETPLLRTMATFIDDFKGERIRSAATSMKMMFITEDEAIKALGLGDVADGLDRLQDRMPGNVVRLLPISPMDGARDS